MHCSVRGKNVTHIQRVLTELCCIMLDNVDHSVFWGLFLMVWQQQRVQIKHCSTILICLSLSLPDSDWTSEKLTVCLPERSKLFQLGTPVRKMCKISSWGSTSLFLLSGGLVIPLESDLKPEKWWRITPGYVQKAHMCVTQEDRIFTQPH